MTAVTGPFDPGPEGRESHLLLENDRGQRSLWPVWRTVPEGWTAGFGPAPFGACVERLESTP